MRKHFINKMCRSSSVKLLLTMAVPMRSPCFPFVIPISLFILKSLISPHSLSVISTIYKFITYKQPICITLYLYAVFLCHLSLYYTVESLSLKLKIIEFLLYFFNHKPACFKYRKYLLKKQIRKLLVACQ